MLACNRITNIPHVLRYRYTSTHFPACPWGTGHSCKIQSCWNIGLLGNTASSHTRWCLLNTSNLPHTHVNGLEHLKWKRSSWNAHFFTLPAWRMLLTSEPWRAFTSVPTGCVYTLTNGTRRRHTFIHVLVTEFPLTAAGTCAQVPPTACWEINVRHTGSSVLTSTGEHVDL